MNAPVDAVQGDSGVKPALGGNGGQLNFVFCSMVL